MAVTAYTGVPGSGKSYALVSEVIVPALAKGRRVVSNVDGLRPDAIRAYLEKSGGLVGELVQFRGEQTLQASFWPADGADNSATIFRPGDLLVMDEVRLYWPPRGKFPPFITAFLRFHRHWVAEDGTSTDIVLASQLLTDFHLDYRGLIERNYKFKKLSTLGLNNRYVWNSWEGARQDAREKAAKGGGKYRPEIFDLYSSYKGGAKGQSVATDRRVNVLASPKLWAMIAGGVAALGFCVYSLVSFFSPGAAAAETDAPAEAPKAAPGNPYGATGPGTPVPRAMARPDPLPMSSTWRIAGLVDLPGKRLVVLADRSGAVRLESPSLFLFQNGEPVAGVVEGERVVASSVAVTGKGETVGALGVG